MSHRTDINTLNPADRQALVNLMLQYLTDAVVAQHMSINHSGLDLFTGHRAYIAGMEAFLSANGGGAFVPLPLWDPANPIPPEFNVVKAEDNGTPRPPLINLNPNMPLRPEWDYPAVCSFESGADLGNAINGWHGGVHVAIDGTMGDIMIASAAPIFWCWHAFVDHIYWDWQRCQVESPPLVGYPLGWAKYKLQCAGLKTGCVTRLPSYCVPPDCLPPARRPDPSPPHGTHGAGHQHGDPQPPDSHSHPGSGSHGGHGRKEQGASYAADKPPQGGHGDPTGHPGHDGHEDPFRNPQPDYSHLMRGPVVISQSPGEHSMVSRCQPIDLVVVEGC